MHVYRQDEQDVSKIFTFVRAKLQAKEKELLQLQRSDPCLLAPDSEQIDLLIDAIASLQLSTQDGSFVFASTADHDKTTRYTSDCSADFNAIKNLPSTVWLAPQSSTVKQQNERRRPSLFSHLLSLPIDAYLASSWPSLFQISIKAQTQVIHHIPMANHLFCMPISVFKPSIPIANHLLCMPMDIFKPAPTPCTVIDTPNNTKVENNVLPTTETKIKSLMDTGTMFSKEFWIQNNRNGSCNYEIS